MAILNVRIPTNLTEYPNSFKRQGSFPLEAYSVFYDITNDEGAVVTSALDAAKDYAQNNPIAYVGQIIAVIEDTIVGEETVKTATAYVIDNAAGDLKAIGASEAITSGMEELEGQIDAIEVVIGDENSGLIKDIADNADAIDAINDKIGDIGDKTIAKAIEDAQAAATYDDTDVKDSIAALEELVGEEAVETQIDNKIEELKLSETYASKEAYDAYVEANDEAVAANAAAIEKLNSDDKTEGSVDYKIAQEVAKILNDNDDDVDTLEEIAAWIKNDTAGVGALNKSVTDNADAIEAIKKDATIDTFKGIEDKIAELAEEVAGDIEAAIETATEHVETVETDIADLKELVGNTSVDSQIDAKIADLNDAMHTHENADVLEGITAEKVEAWDGAEQGAKDYADDLKDELIGLIDKRVIAEDGKSLVSDTLIGKLEGIASGAQVNVIDTVDTAQFGLTGKHLTLLDITMGKVTGLTDALAGKLDKPTDGSRLLTEDEATKLEKLVLGENGEVSVSGKVAAGNVDGLDAWITARAGTLKGLSENNFTGTLLEKLNGIETGAQVNVIEKVKVGDTLIDIVDKTVAIPVASSTLLGAVKSSAEANKVAVAEDGTMEVNNLNVNRLVQSEGDVIVLDGGASK